MGIVRMVLVGEVVNKYFSKRFPLSDISIVRKVLMRAMLEKFPPSQEILWFTVNKNRNFNNYMIRQLSPNVNTYVEYK